MTDLPLPYGTVPASLATRLGAIRLLVCDVDGVFSDGRIYLGNYGEELKAFHTRDGFGVKALVKAGVKVAVITGRESAIVAQRMRALDVAFILQGIEDKAQALQKLMQQLGLSAGEVACVGDDVPDLGMFTHAGVTIAVNDAHPSLLQQADWVTQLGGGKGAVREICDTLLWANAHTANPIGFSL